MVKAVVSRGEIRPLEPLPADWQEGQPLRVEKEDGDETPVEEIDRDFAILASLCAASEPANEDQLERARRSAPPGQGAGPSASGACLMPDYLLDCNHLSASLRRVSPVRERVHQGRRAGHRFISCYPVLCELGSWLTLSNCRFVVSEAHQ